MKAFYGLILETQKEERTYQLCAPIGVQFDEVKAVLDTFKSMIEEMAQKAIEKEESEKAQQDVSVELVESLDEKESDGTNS